MAAFRPELSRRRKRQQALQRLSAAAAVDLAFSQALLDPPTLPGELYPLHAAGHADEPVLNDVLALETPGLAAKFFFRDTATGAADLSVPGAANLDYARGGGNPLPANPTPGNAISGIWTGQVETPEAGFYNFVVEADSGATVTLMLGAQAPLLTQNGNIRRNTEPLELDAGTLYEIMLTVEKVKDTLRVKWETPKRAREVIPARYLYPPTILAPFSDSYTRFLKASALVTTLGLTANEMAYFATHSDYRINANGQIDSNGQGWLNALPSADNFHLTNPADAAIAKNLNEALLTPLSAPLDFARIKAEISPSDESLLAVFKDPAKATQNTDSLLFTITRWNQTSLNNVLAQFSGNIAGLGHFDLFRRVYDAFALIQTMGISANALIQATTNEPDGDRVRGMQAALRARYDAADWRDVVQPINDAMRSLQRDALVAYILHQMRSKPATEHIDTADKLFEYFLMDVQMEPCMQTSRIRHALSSVQLFIERCLMNLEPRVSPASINAKQWEWMKRYRVWEANRKVFLFPENWLEPELRDDKSPFFKEIESELLQSDITEDSATTALLNYLSKLAEVAKLEPCGIYHVERNEALRTGEIDHVIARTAGANRKYYYRRYEGYWTPWEQIKLDIEDNPVIPVVWNGRLFLFWLRILKQTPNAAMQMPPAEVELKEGMQMSSIVPRDAMKVGVQAVLCWSEYYNGKWQPANTSDVNRPNELGLFPPAGEDAFDRSSLSPRLLERNGVLMVIVGSYLKSFLLNNTHSLPVNSDDLPGDELDYWDDLTAIIRDIRILSQDMNERDLKPFTGLYYRRYQARGGYLHYDSKFQHTVLQPPNRFKLIEPCNTWLNLKRPFETPFFFSDSRHVFFVTTTEQQVWIPDYTGYYMEIKVNIHPGIMATLPGLVIKTDPQKEVGPTFWGGGGPIGPGVIDPAPMQRFVTEDAYIRQGIGTTGSVNYGDKQIGPSGAIADAVAKMNR